MVGSAGEHHEPVLHSLPAGEPMLRGIVELMQEGVVVYDADGRIIEATPSACALLGVPSERLLGTTDAQIYGAAPGTEDWPVLDPDGGPFPAERSPARLAARTGRPATDHLGVGRPDGTTVWLRVSAVPVPLGDGRSMVVSTFVDETQAVESRRRLAESEQRFRLTLRHAPIGMAIVGLDGTFLEVNPRLAQMLATRPEALAGRTYQSVTHPDDVAADELLVRRLVEGAVDGYDMEKRYLAADGSVVWAHLAVALVRAADGTPLHFVSQIEDVTEARRAKELLEHRVLHDPLTGLANRALFADRLQQLLDRAPAGPEPTAAVLCCGVDDLEQVNDSLGHGAGDVLLTAVAERLCAFGGGAAHAGRSSGDEFFVALEGLGPDRSPTELAQALVDEIARPLEVHGHALRTTVSVGISTVGAGAVAEDALHDASVAMHEAKGAGRGRWMEFEGDLRARAAERLTVRTDLAAAVEHGQLALHYQPIVELWNGRVIAFEALARWAHPERGLVPPSVFVPIAEDTGLIDAVGAELFDQACSFVGRHRDAEVERVFVNVSPAQLGSGRFAESVRASLRRHRVPPGRLGLELTETAVLQAGGSTYQELHQLAELGLELVLDDFGTGYTALASLLAFPITGIKLDRSFTGSLGRDEQAGLVTRALAGMVDALGFHGVVVGVEAEAQRRAALQHGWRHGQGWLFGRPAPEGSLAVPR